jgi:hypothetical protein
MSKSALLNRRGSNVVMNLEFLDFDYYFSFRLESMINWKIFLAFLLIIEALYGSISHYNARLATEPFCLTYVHCPNQHMRLIYHYGSQETPSMGFFARLYHNGLLHNWYKLVERQNYRCQTIEFRIYLWDIVRAIDTVLLVGFLISVVYGIVVRKRREIKEA